MAPCEKTTRLSCQLLAIGCQLLLKEMWKCNYNTKPYPVIQFNQQKGKIINICSAKKPPFRPYGHLSPIGGKATTPIPVVEELVGISPCGGKYKRGR